MNNFSRLECEYDLYCPDKARLTVGPDTYLGEPRLEEPVLADLRASSLDPVRCGTRLFEAVFPSGSRLLEGYRQSVKLASSQGATLAFRLNLAPSLPIRLHRLPWEALYDPTQDAPISCLAAFSRFASVDAPMCPSVDRRPRLLLAISAPCNSAEYGLARLDRDELLNQLDESIAPLQEVADCEILEGKATLERIRMRLRQGFQSFHITAHGVLPVRSSACLVLEKNDGSAHFVNEQQLSQLFLGDKWLRLVTVVACSGADLSGRDPFSGLAGRLVRRGLPSVIAMQQAVTFEMAKDFTRHFYRNLTNGVIDSAVREARHQLFLDNPQSTRWTSPALYSRLQNGRLWPAKGPLHGANRPGAKSAQQNVINEDRIGTQLNAGSIKELKLIYKTNEIG